MPYLSLDFDQLEKQFSRVFEQAETRLNRLLDNSASTSSAGLDDFVNSTISREVVEYELQLGSTRLSLEEINALQIGTILPLISSEQGHVSIVSNGKVCGKGVLLVVDGKLALRVESIETAS